MADIILPVRLVAGDRIDVIYTSRPGTDAEEALGNVIATLADDSGALHVRHVTARWCSSPAEWPWSRSPLAVRSCDPDEHAPIPNSAQRTAS